MLVLKARRSCGPQELRSGRAQELSSASVSEIVQGCRAQAAKELRS